jgi:hypothetical protein
MNAQPVLDYLNQNPAQVAALAALVAVGLQYAVNRVKELGELSNYVLGLAALPGFTTAVAAYSTSLHASSYPWVVVAGQAAYAVLEAYKRRVVAKASAPVAETPSFLNEAPVQISEPTVNEY